jgi:hypothetical protein
VITELSEIQQQSVHYFIELKLYHGFSSEYSFVDLFVALKDQKDPLAML